MNEIMELLTMIATISIPLAVIAGIYGMNFDPGASSWNMPKLRWRYGYPVTLAAMVVVTLAPVAFLVRRGWSGRGSAT